jgi:hypothetical protein
MAARPLPLIGISKPLTLFSVGRICHRHVFVNKAQDQLL